MLNSCSDPLVCTQETTAYFIEIQSLSIEMRSGGVPTTGFWNGASTLKQYFILFKNGSKYYLKYTFLAFHVLGILGLGTPLIRSQ